MKQILLFGAGKSATVLIDYLKQVAVANHWQVLVADQDLALAAEKTGGHELVKPVGISIGDAAARSQLISGADIVISLLPPSLHLLVAEDCIVWKKPLLTASYVSDDLKKLAPAVQEAGILFLCEMGLDPGIDHMSAMQLIHRIRNAGGTIGSFVSHCGGLVAPESNNNPWQYKISWNPRNIVLAGKAGALYKENNKVRSTAYETLFANCSAVMVDGIGELAYYPNRDSLAYMELYALEQAETFIRTTLRYPDFCKGWERIVALGLTNENDRIDTRQLSYGSFFQQAARQQNYFPDTDLAKRQFDFLGWDDPSILNIGIRSSADILQSILEKKWLLEENDRDMVVMMHEIGYRVENKNKKAIATLIVKGEDGLHTAMAKTVGLPLGIAATLLLKGKIHATGLHIPVIPEIYEPVLEELAAHGILFREKLMG
jgi:saccharopine dehydrogenase (NADP+, L-glutamate forming)